MIAQQVPVQVWNFEEEKCGVKCGMKKSQPIAMFSTTEQSQAAFGELFLFSPLAKLHPPSLSWINSVFFKPLCPSIEVTHKTSTSIAYLDIWIERTCAHYQPTYLITTVCLLLFSLTAMSTDIKLHVKSRSAGSFLSCRRSWLWMHSEVAKLSENKGSACPSLSLVSNVQTGVVIKKDLRRIWSGFAYSHVLEWVHQLLSWWKRSTKLFMTLQQLGCVSLRI